MATELAIENPEPKGYLPDHERFSYHWGCDYPGGPVSGYRRIRLECADNRAY
jgi:hypothetical protein